MKQENGIRIATTLCLCLPAVPGFFVVALPAIVRMRVRSVLSATLVMHTTTTRGVGFLWQEARSAFS